MEFRPRIVIPGHGPVSTDPMADLQLTRDYLLHLRRTMGEAARNLEPFEDAYAKADWSRYESLLPFKAANRMNAYNIYLLMERLRLTALAGLLDDGALHAINGELEPASGP